ncbi:MAG: O-antigen ligase family protein [Eubacterium sp.]|nr:O-antigen ligase family protein [Eubacterium sp.]
MKLGKNRWSVYQILACVLIVSVWAFNEEKYITYPAKILFILVYGFHWLSNSKGKINKYQGWCLLMCLFSVMAIFPASGMGTAIHTLINMLQVFLIGFVLSGYLKEKKEITLFFKFFVVGGFVLLVRLLIVTPTSVWLSYERLGESIGYNANDVGNKAAIAAIIAICLFKDKKEKYRRIYLLMFIAMAILVLFSGSRKSLLAVVVTVILIYTIGLENKKNIFFALIGISIGLIVAYQFMMHNESLYMTIGRRVESLIDVAFKGASEASSIDLREKYMKLAWGLIKKRPIFGVGLGNFAIVSGIGIYCHCDYLEVMCSYGVPVSIFYYSLLGILLIKIITMKRKNTYGYMVLILCIVLMMSFTTMVMYISAYVHILFAMIYKYIYRKGD